MMATLPASSPAGLQRFLAGLAALARFDRGTAAFEVDEAGELVPAGTVVTIKMERNESLEAFHQRLRRDYGLQRGDRIEILNNGGRVDTARLVLQPR
jgi:hypothetical protein